MAYPTAISCNRSLEAGVTDGAWKKYASNRGGVVERSSMEVRRQTCGIWHGFAEASKKVMPNGEIVNTLYFEDMSHDKGDI